MTLTFEDFPVGRFGTFGPRHVSREEILGICGQNTIPAAECISIEEAASKTMLQGAVRLGLASLR